MATKAPQYCLTFQSAHDRPGIVAKIASTLASNGLNITESAQFGDTTTNSFFLRTAFTAEPNASLKDLASITSTFEPIGKELDGQLEVHALDDKPRVVILVSKIGHCLVDLLHRTQTGSLPIHIAAVVSNHPDFRPLVESHGIAFHHIPVTSGSKSEAEDQLLELCERENVKLLIMARYMQVLTAKVVNKIDTLNVQCVLRVRAV